jgi:hypothetical protein
MYGSILDQDGFNGINDEITIDMPYPGGMYIVKIVTADQVRSYNIIKQ